MGCGPACDGAGMNDEFSHSSISFNDDGTVTIEVTARSFSTKDAAYLAHDETRRVCGEVGVFIDSGSRDDEDDDCDDDGGPRATVSWDDLNFSGPVKVTLSDCETPCDDDIQVGPPSAAMSLRESIMKVAEVLSLPELDDLIQYATTLAHGQRGDECRPIQPGDVVRLKSGGLHKTVASIDDDGIVTCHREAEESNPFFAGKFMVTKVETHPIATLERVS
jgi:hypothetical protein